MLLLLLTHERAPFGIVCIASAIGINREVRARALLPQGDHTAHQPGLWQNTHKQNVDRSKSHIPMPMLTNVLPCVFTPLRIRAFPRTARAHVQPAFHRTADSVALWLFIWTCLLFPNRTTQIVFNKTKLFDNRRRFILLVRVFWINACVAISHDYRSENIFHCIRYYQSIFTCRFGMNSQI